MAAIPAVITGVRQYFKDVRSEMRKVVWPSRPELISSTIIVIVTVLFFSLYISALDGLFSQVITLISGIRGGI